MKIISTELKPTLHTHIFSRRKNQEQKKSRLSRLVGCCFVIVCVSILFANCAELDESDIEMIGMEVDELRVPPIWIPPVIIPSYLRTSFDVNGDGYEDLAAGGTGIGVNGNIVQVYYGGPDGLPESPSLSISAPAGNSSGFFAVARAGDVNGDGYDDMVVGANSVEKAYLFLGGPSGLSATPSQVISKPSGASAFGWAATGARDVNGDGYSDVVISAVATGSTEAYQFGRAYLFLGNSSGVSSSPDAVLQGSGEHNSNFGYDMTSAEINGDFYTDIIITEHRYFEWGGSAVGRVFVFLGGESGLSSTTSIVRSCPDGDFLDFGNSVANVGDFNRDGFADIAVGAPGFDGNTGRVYLYTGHSSGIDSTPVRSFSPPAGDSGGYFGWSVTGIGDVNSDDYSDLVIGETDALGNEGRAHLFLGRSSIVRYPAPPRPWNDNVADQVLVGTHTGPGYFGQNSTLSDVNGDDIDDLVIAATAASGNRGRLYTFHVDSDGIENSPSTTIVGPSGAHLGLRLTR